MSLNRLFISLTRSAVCVIAIFLLYTFVLDDHNSLYEVLLRSAIRSRVQSGRVVESYRHLSNSTQNAHSSIWKHEPDLPTNKSIKLLLRCSLRPNEYTNHVRIQDTPFLNVSLSSSREDSGGSTASDDKRYFNPTLIPLPPWSPHPYLLVSRLVTAGLHQESHVCFAAFCTSKRFSSTAKPLPPDTQHCDLDESEAKVDNNTAPSKSSDPVLRCVTEPQPLNIPPTPARKCQGPWSAFPDIPGFHDPRVFWSGDGEPLVIVNSGSQYGCVGLWVVDLRSVVIGLEDILEAKPRGIGGDDNDGSGIAAGWTGMLSYPHLTELTRWEGRQAVEKNWVMFFPRAGQSWVMYDVLGRDQKGKSSSEIEMPWLPVIPAEMQDEPELRWAVFDESRTKVGHPSFNHTPKSNHRLNGTSVNSRAYLNSAGHVENGNTTKAVGADEQKATGHRNLTRLSSAKINSENITKRSPSNLPPLIIPSRTFAKLVGHGFTTPNLTSPFEPPCFNSSHILDPLGNTGHWHQGSNALRLVLCHRQHHQVPKPNQNEHQSKEAESADDSSTLCRLTVANEAEMIRQGRVVHFMVMHRKFSNEMELPMRYERYFMVWEARWPFRVLGVSRYPVLLGDEMARPWSRRMNFGDGEVNDNHGGNGSGEAELGKRLEKRDHEQAAEGDKDEHQNEPDTSSSSWVSDVYFTYTPSLAWAWRGRGSDDGDSLGADRSLGTGYLDDEVIVGTGMDDVAQAVVKVKAEKFLGCLRLCPDFE